MPTFHPWYNTTTTNFATFVGNNEVIPTGAAGDQDGALGTGSVFKKDGIYYGFYTGHNGNLDPKEKIMLALSLTLNLLNLLSGPTITKPESGILRGLLDI